MGPCVTFGPARFAVDLASDLLDKKLWELMIYKPSIASDSPCDSAMNVRHNDNLIMNTEYGNLDWHSVTK